MDTTAFEDRVQLAVELDGEDADSSMIRIVKDVQTERAWVLGVGEEDWDIIAELHPQPNGELWFSGPGIAPRFIWVDTWAWAVMDQIRG